jgi:hypothetical protein
MAYYRIACTHGRKKHIAVHIGMRVMATGKGGGGKKGEAVTVDNNENTSCQVAACG